jgi:RNA polymerase sigma factor (TIGR02999 family)
VGIAEGFRVETSVAALMEASDAGDPAAAEALFSELYAELHRVAKRELARQGAAVSLGPTTVLHEAYLGMAKRQGASFPDQARFLGYAARVMRGLIIDHVRSRRAEKRGGGFHLTAMPTDVPAGAPDAQELTRISRALEELARTEAPLAELVDLKFFCGFSFAEIAAMRNVSDRTVQRQWQKARIYLHRAIRVDVAN